MSPFHTGKHYLLLDNVKRSASLHRDLAERLFMAPSVSFSQLTTSLVTYNKSFYSQVITGYFSGVTSITNVDCSSF